MNRLPLATRLQILSALVEGASIRGTARMVGVDKKTVLRLLADVGDACAVYHLANVKGVKSERIQCDEVWSFCHAKERNLRKELRGEPGVGDMWTWTAIDADSKMIVSWHLGKRQRHDANTFMVDLASRIASKYVQITTDGFGIYKDAIQNLFARADHGTEVKVYGRLPFEGADTKYSPMVVKEVIRTPIWGEPDLRYMTTAHVERHNLTMRMSMRRFTRLTNGFSKKALNLYRALALYFMHYNFCRTHRSVKTTPAMKAGLTDRIWTLYDLANLPDLMRGDSGLAA